MHEANDTGMIGVVEGAMGFPMRGADHKKYFPY